MEKIQYTPEQLAELVKGIPYASDMIFEYSFNFEHSGKSVVVLDTKSKLEFLIFGEDKKNITIDGITRISNQGNAIELKMYRSEGLEVLKMWRNIIIDYAKLFYPEPVLDFSEKLETDYYNKPSIPFPFINDTLVRKSVEDVFVGTKKQIEEEVQRKLKDTKDEFRKLKDQYYAEKAKLSNEFKEDLFLHYNVFGNKKSEMLFVIVSEKYHSDDKSDIAEYFSELVKLIQ